MSNIDFLKKANIAKYINALSNDDVIKKLLSRDDTEEPSSELIKIISDMLQSLTTNPVYIHEFLKQIYDKYNTKTIKELAEFVKIVHAKNYKITNKTLLKDTDFVIKKEIPTSVHNAPLEPNTRYKHKYDYGLLSESIESIDANNLIYNVEELLYREDDNKNISLNINNTKQNNIDISKDSPSVAFIMLNHPELKIGIKNNLELSTFFNTLSSIELSKCYPYFNASFILPSNIKTTGGNVYKTASITQHLNGTPVGSSVTENYRHFEASFSKVDGKGREKAAVKTNLSAFTMPQTVNNFNETYVGHNSNVKSNNSFIRKNAIHDITKPFLTIKSFTIDVAPTQGLMSFKTGTMSIVLHDRTRMQDIAPFIKPDLFGSFGAEIAVEYGWSHMDANISSVRKNYIAEFLENNKVLEKYIIVNSSYTIDNDGQVNIELSIAMRGPIDIKNIKFKTDTKSKLNKDRLRTLEKTLKETLKLNKDEDEPSSDERNSIVKSIDNFKNIYSKESKSTLTISADQKQQIEILYNQVKSKDSTLKDVASDALNTTVEYANAEAAYINELKKVSDNFFKQQQEIEDILAIFLPGASNSDPFYDKEWRRKYEYIIKSINSYAHGITKKGLARSENHDFEKYVTFGSFILTLLGTHMSQTGNYDEIQIISYTANDQCGLMSNRNIASFLIDIDELTEYLEKLLNTGAEYTLESLITLIIKKFISSRTSINYGLSDLYTVDENGSVTTKSDKEEHKAKTDNRLAHIYEGIPIDIAGNASEIDTIDIEFKMPKIKFSFDTMIKKENDLSSTICRISIFDQNDNPFSSINEIMHNSFSEIVNVASEINRLNRRIKNKNKNDKITQKVLSKKKKLVDRLTTGDNPILKLQTSSNNKKPTYVINRSVRSNIKEFTKSIMPSITYGTQNSILIDSSISTINESKLNTVYLTRADRNSSDEETLASIKTDLPLEILPSRASVTMFGCPFVNFAQYIFLDFETGTTVDNQYAVNGIKHSITPGSFTTTLVLSYGDVYGKYRSAIKTLMKEDIPKIEKATFTPSAQDGLNATQTALSEKQIKIERAEKATYGVKTYINALSNRRNRASVDTVNYRYNKAYKKPLFRASEQSLFFDAKKVDRKNEKGESYPTNGGVRDDAVSNMNTTLDRYLSLQKEFHKKHSKLLYITDAIHSQADFDKSATESNPWPRTPGTRHNKGTAIDIRVSDWSNDEKLDLFYFALKHGFSGFGIGKNTVHMDRRSATERIPGAIWTYRGIDNNNIFGKHETKSSLKSIINNTTTIHQSVFKPVDESKIIEKQSEDTSVFEPPPTVISGPVNKVKYENEVIKELSKHNIVSTLKESIVTQLSSVQDANQIIINSGAGIRYFNNHVTIIPKINNTILTTTGDTNNIILISDSEGINIEKYPNISVIVKIDDLTIGQNNLLFNNILETDPTPPQFYDTDTLKNELIKIASSKYKLINRFEYHTFYEILPTQSESIDIKIKDSLYNIFKAANINVSNINRFVSKFDDYEDDIFYKVVDTTGKIKKYNIDVYHVYMFGDLINKKAENGGSKTTELKNVPLVIANVFTFSNMPFIVDYINMSEDKLKDHHDFISKLLESDEDEGIPIEDSKYDVIKRFTSYFNNITYEGNNYKFVSTF